jgi:biotin carboxylase
VNARTNVFVVGLDEPNLEVLQALPDANEYEFHGLSDVERLLHSDHIDMPELLEECVHQLEDFDGSIGAIIGFWDFPVSTMVPILCQRFGLPGAPLSAVVKCEHKYWSRLEQQQVIEEYPKFGIIDLDGPDRLPDGMGFPAWVKPVKSVSSFLAFHVDDEEELADALAQIRDGIDLMGDPFDWVLQRLELPPEIAQVGARACLAEEAIGGRQMTVEGFSHEGKPHVYGIVESISYPDTPSFLRYQYPADLPGHTVERLVRASERVIAQIGLDTSTFNIEFFCDMDNDAVNLLEVNPRHSQSHARLFEYVDAMANHEFMLRMALGRPPHRLTKGDGKYETAAKWFLRRFEDGQVRRSPTPEEVRATEEEIDGVAVHIVAQAGDRLSELTQQDSYSYELARIEVGGRDESDLIDKYERCVERLPFEFDE